MPFDLAVSYTAPPPVWAVIRTAGTVSKRPRYTSYFLVLLTSLLSGIHVSALALAARGGEGDATLKDTGYISYLMAEYAIVNGHTRNFLRVHSAVAIS